MSLLLVTSRTNLHEQYQCAGSNGNRREAGEGPSRDSESTGARQSESPGTRTSAGRDGFCEHGFHPFPDLGRLASLEVLRAGSGGLTNHATTSLARELYRRRLRADSEV